MNIAWFGEVQTGGMCLFGSFFSQTMLFTFSRSFETGVQAVLFK